MKNMEMNVKDNVLTITIDLNARLGNSKSGKSIVIATSEGNQTLEGHSDIKIGLNCYMTAEK